jgi:hypothetical protein
VGCVVETARSLIPSPLLRPRVGELEGVVLQEAGDLRYFLGRTLSPLSLLSLTEVSEI